MKKALMVVGSNPVPSKRKITKMTVCITLALIKPLFAKLNFSQRKILGKFH